MLPVKIAFARHATIRDSPAPSWKSVLIPQISYPDIVYSLDI
jgi:hypothetical protein